MPDDIYLGVKTIPNPKNIQVKSDTDAPEKEDDSYAQTNADNPHTGPTVKVGNRTLDVGTMPTMDSRLSQSTLTPHPLEKHVARPKGARHPLGRQIPVSEN